MPHLELYSHPVYIPGGGGETGWTVCVCVCMCVRASQFAPAS